MHLRGRSIALSRASQPLFALDRWDFYWTRDEFLSSPIAPVNELDLSCEWDNSPAGQPVINGELASPRDLTIGDTPQHERCEILVFAAESRT